MSRESVVASRVSAEIVFLVGDGRIIRIRILHKSSILMKRVNEVTIITYGVVTVSKYNLQLMIWYESFHPQMEVSTREKHKLTCQSVNMTTFSNQSCV